jgi:4'-phosphopantetheinyl transferase
VSEINGNWVTPPDVLRISLQEIHVWRIRLAQPSETVKRLEQVLNTEEIKRADRYRTELLRIRFVIGRGSLRTILGRYVAEAPEQLAFRYGERGKPALADRSSGLDIQFNTSNSNDIAVVAIALGRQLGVDVEQVRPIENFDRIVAHHFSAQERSGFSRLSEDQRLEAFFRCWTRKEAYLKATGEGLSRALDSFDVSLAPGDSPKLLRVDGSPEELTRWEFQDLLVGRNYIGSIAVEGPGWELKPYQHEP